MRKSLNKAFKEQSESRGSKSSRRNSSRMRSSTKLKTLRDIYASPPIKIVKMKVDNTYDYKLPPFYLEAFCQFMLESDDGMRKLLELHK